MLSIVLEFLSMVWNGVMEIRYHLFRSSLSLIGIILGVMNLSAMFSIIEGAKLANESVMDSLGTPEMVSIWLDYQKTKNATDRRFFKLTWDDVDSLKRDCFTIKAVGVEIETRETVTAGTKSYSFQMMGVLPETFGMNRYDVETGRQFNQFDEERADRVCVLGSEVAKKIFGKEDPVGKSVRLRDTYFRVVGVLSEFGKVWADKGKYNPMSWKNERVLIPARTMQSYFTGRGNFSIFVQSLSVDTIDRTIDEVRSVLLRNHNNRDIFMIRSMAEWQNERENFTRIWQIVLGVVSGISLIVGGVGIMNVMLASFTERMREIGIRKAVGATNLDIFLLFLVETIVICAIGGMIGLGLGYVISTTAIDKMLTETMNTPAKFSIASGFVAVLFSMGVGLVAGLYPAIRASRLSPVEALRYE